MVAVPVTPLLQGAQSGTTTLPDLPLAAMWTCAMVAGPVSFAKDSFHLSVVPLSVALNRPCAALSLTTCLGTSCPDDRAAVQTVVRVAADDSAESASAQTAPVASSMTSFLMVSSLRLLDRPRRPIEPPGYRVDRSPSPSATATARIRNRNDLDRTVTSHRRQPAIRVRASCRLDLPLPTGASGRDM